MPTPTFSELLARTQEVSRNIAESKEVPFAESLLKGLSGFAEPFLKPREQFVSTISPETGDITRLTKPTPTEPSFLESLFGVKRPTGGTPLTQAQETEFGLKSLLQKDYEIVDPKTGQIIRTTRNKPSFLGTGKSYLQTQLAISSGFATERELANLFPEVPNTQYFSIPVSEVMAKRAERRAEVIAGLRSATAEEVKDLANADVLKTQISRVKELAQSTGYKGIGIGASVVGKLGQYSPVEAFSTDADTVELYQQLNDVMNQMIYLRSGKQINEQEFERLKSAFPSPNLNETAFKTRLETFSNVFDEVMKAREIRLSGTGRRVGGEVIKNKKIKDQTKPTQNTAEDILKKYGVK